MICNFVMILFYVLVTTFITYRNAYLVVFRFCNVFVMALKLLSQYPYRFTQI